MQTATPSTTRPRAARPKTPAIPALMPIPPSESKSFWPVCALNDDAELQAIEALRSNESRLGREEDSRYTIGMALISARMHIKESRDFAVVNARNDGNLLYAWRGSKALLQTLPAGLEGGAA